MRYNMDISQWFSILYHSYLVNFVQYLFEIVKFRYSQFVLLPMQILSISSVLFKQHGHKFHYKRYSIFRLLELTKKLEINKEKRQGSFSETDERIDMKMLV